MKNILIVDDEENIRTRYESELSSEGISTHSVASGEEALRYIEENPDTDLVILDIKLPKMDGLTVMEEIRSRKMSMPVILNSAYPTYKSNFISWLADACLVKSSNLTELKNQVKGLLAF